ncbi:hypothetical protein TNCV_1509731 [Trichonephila clavipes]|nr:hypothetical protein TNCV_1509731 [Trichonephila clavipes]
MAQQKVWVEDAHKMSAPFRTTYLLNSRDISRDKKNDREKLRYLEYLLLTVEKSRLCMSHTLLRNKGYLPG